MTVMMYSSSIQNLIILGFRQSLPTPMASHMHLFSPNHLYSILTSTPTHTSYHSHKSWSWMMVHIQASPWTASADLAWVWQLSHLYDNTYWSRMVAWHLQHSSESSLNVSALKDIANAQPNDFCHWFPMKVQLMCKNQHKDARCYDTVLLRSKSDNPQLWTISPSSYGFSYAATLS